MLRLRQLRLRQLPVAARSEDNSLRATARRLFLWMMARSKRRLSMNTFKKIAAAGLIGLAAVQSAHAGGWIPDITKIIKQLPPGPDRTDCFPSRVPPEIFCPRTDDGCKFPVLVR
jgi:hypothetical protein